MVELKVGACIKIPNSHPVGAVWRITAIYDGMARVRHGAETTHWFLEDLADAEAVEECAEAD